MERGKRKETIHPHPTRPVVKSYTRRARFSGTFLDNVNVKISNGLKLQDRKTKLKFACNKRILLVFIVCGPFNRLNNAVIVMIALAN